MDDKADRSKRILLARCNNCENRIRAYGKRCAWRSLSNDYCFDGMDIEAAHEKIGAEFDDFTKVIYKENLVRIQ